MTDQTGWIEVSLEVDGELAEAVADVFGRYIASGVVLEQQAPPDSNRGEEQTNVPVRVYGYLPNDERVSRKKRKIEEGLLYLGMITPIPKPEYQLILEEDWSQIWKEDFHPFQIGKKLVVQPPWFEPERNTGRVPILIDPGMAFGMGTHPTTSLALKIIEDILQPGWPMIDVGCGTGILSIASLKLGASHALGVDIDPKAIREAKKNARLNQVEGELELGLGSVNSILEGGYSLQQAPLVVANLVSSYLVQVLYQGLGDLVSNAGYLTLSGMLVEQEDEVLEAVVERGFAVAARYQLEDWVALLLKASK